MTRTQSPGLASTFTTEEIEAARAGGKLLSLDISLTRRCDYRCVYCYVGESNSHGNELTYAEIIRLIDEARELGLKTLNLTGGEPLLHERYFEIAKYAQQKGISMLLFTNGTHVTDQAARKLAALDVGACVKLDSLSPTIQERLAGRVGDGEAGVRAVSNLIAAGYTRDSLALSVNAVACRQNIAEIPAIWRWARERGAVPFLTRLQPMGRARDGRGLAVSVQQLKDLFSTLSRLDREYGFEWAPDTPWVHAKPCRRHLIGCFVDAQGNVQPCSGVPVKAGNVREKTLGEILESADVFKVARNIDRQVQGSCSRCGHRQACYGCRSLAYCATGNFTAADPLCWNNPEAIKTS